MAAAVFYISGHGFGHAVRQIAIINALGLRSSALDIIVRTTAPRRLFDQTVRVPITFIEGPTDTGVVQVDSVRLDERGRLRSRRSSTGRCRPEPQPKPRCSPRMMRGW